VKLHIRLCAAYCVAYGPSVPQPASPGPGKRGVPPRGPPGPNTPVQQPPAPNYTERGSPLIPRPTPPPAQHSRVQQDVGNKLADLELALLPAHQKHEAEDWFAVFNPRVQRLLDVELVHNLQHESVVCCVRFSQDGKYVATGCNRAAQIYDVQSGRLITSLTDDSVDKDGDLYIRSVCFSPDGRYLATGAEDKLIRVSKEITLYIVKLTFFRYGILPPNKSRILLLDMSKTFIR
jgi:general transcriptional corepressor TUP1